MPLPVLPRDPRYSQVLAGDVGGVVAGLAVTAVAEHQHALVLGTGGRIGHEQLDPAPTDLLGVPPRRPTAPPTGTTATPAPPCAAPATGSAPASAVSVLLRSRGSSRPAR